MSDVEEPPSKMSKYTDLQYLDECEEALDEGQEEWLSEGVLTDDDFNATVETDQNENNTSTSNPAEETPQNQDERPEVKDTHDTEETKSQLNIEATLNTLDAVKKDNELPEDLNTFLIRKADGKVLDSKVVKEEQIESQDAVKDDGNDTDDLLRMLGEDNMRLKKKTFRMVKCEKIDEGSSDDDDDDEFIYERSKMKTLRLAKNVLMTHQPASRARQEDLSDDTDGQSSDEVNTVKRMFGVARGANIKKQPANHVVQLNINKTETPTQKQVKQYTNKNVQPKSILKPAPKPQADTKPIVKSIEIKTPAPFKPMDTTLKSEGVKSNEKKSDPFDEIIDEEFLDDEALDEEELGSESEDEGARHRIRRPERMDEDAPSDADTHTEDGSLYDELPSSDSDDMEDWFALDIRSERAGDYLPLLGCKARSLLLAERTRVEARVATLRQSLGALTASARKQADQLRAAAMALAEIDDTLRAA